MEAAPMNARDQIIAAIRRGRGTGPVPDRYIPPPVPDPVARFRERVPATHTALHLIGKAEDAPEAIAALLAAAGAPAKIHLPATSPLRSLPWQRTPALAVAADPPSGENWAFSAADGAIAETGTLIFCAGPGRPSAWHFLPGHEIVLVRADTIVADLETFLAACPRLPSTINLVTGPSRTADIEQTIERGAHGPRSLHILLAASANP
jgi:L-lactate dehydrogenase complex protein LldG